MGFWAGLLAMLAMASAALAASRRKHAREDAAWNAVARALELRFVATGQGRVGGLLAGAVGGFRVRVETRAEAGGATCVVTVSGGGIPSDLSAERRALWAASLGPPPLELGDADFDREVVVHGRSARALLDAPTRRLLRADLAGGRLKVARGEVEVAAAPEQLADPRALVTLAEQALELARHLALDDGEEAPRLAAIAEHDVNRWVRLGALRALLDAHREHPATLRVLGAAQARGNAPVMRLLAALHAGAEGDPVLDELARGHDGGVAVAALHEAAARGRPYDEVEVRGHLADPDPDVVAAAARSLGEHGTVASVEALLACAGTAPLLGGADVRSAARRAVSLIQSRAVGAEAGRLSLAEERAGALSVATEAGALSVATEAGALSVATEAGALSVARDAGATRGERALRVDREGGGRS